MGTRDRRLRHRRGQRAISRPAGAKARCTIVLVGKILIGDKPADLGVKQPTKFDLLINPYAAKTLGSRFLPIFYLMEAGKIIE